MAELPKDIKRNDYPALSRYWAKRYREAASRLEEFNEANISQKHRIRELEAERDEYMRLARRRRDAFVEVVAERDELRANALKLRREREERCRKGYHEDPDRSGQCILCGYIWDDE